MEEKKKANKGGMVILILICILGIGYYLFSHTTLLDSYLVSDQSESPYVGTWMDYGGHPVWQFNSDGTGYMTRPLDNNGKITSEAYPIIWKDQGESLKVTLRKSMTSITLPIIDGVVCETMDDGSLMDYRFTEKTAEEVYQELNIPYTIVN